MLDAYEHDHVLPIDPRPDHGFSVFRTSPALDVTLLLWCCAGTRPRDIDRSEVSMLCSSLRSMFPVQYELEVRISHHFTQDVRIGVSLVLIL